MAHEWIHDSRERLLLGVVLQGTPRSPCPRDDVGSFPDSASGQYGLRIREVVVALHDGVHPLPRHPEHLRDLGYADQWCTTRPYG